MSREALFEAITNIKDSYIEEADPEAGNGFMPKIRRLRPVMNMAAAFAVVLGIALFAVRSGLLSDKISPTAPADNAAVAEYTLRQADEMPAEAPLEAYAEEEAMEEEAEVEALVEEPADEAAEDAALEKDMSTETPAENAELMSEETKAGTQEYDAMQHERELAVLPDGYPETITWNETKYVWDSVFYLELPDSYEEDGELSNAADAIFRTESDVSLNEPVYVRADDNTCIYIAFEGGFLCYRK